MFPLQKTLKVFTKDLVFLITVHFNPEKEVCKFIRVLFGLSVSS